MIFIGDNHHRHSIRLRHYDYALEGAYFITICTRDRQCLFGNITNDEMALNEWGVMVEKWWRKLNSKFPLVETDACVIMPNHFHGIVVLVGADPSVCPDLGAHVGAPLPQVVQWFKTMTTNEYIRYGKKNSPSRWTPKLWQRNYHEHVIRNAKALDAIRNYIDANPSHWTNDPDNPDCRRPFAAHR